MLQVATSEPWSISGSKGIAVLGDGNRKLSTADVLVDH